MRSKLPDGACDSKRSCSDCASAPVPFTLAVPFSALPFSASPATSSFGQASVAAIASPARRPASCSSRASRRSARRAGS